MSPSHLEPLRQRDPARYERNRERRRDRKLLRRCGLGPPVDESANIPAGALDELAAVRS